MARLFILSFKYKEQSYSAVISLTQSVDSSILTIHLPDAALQAVLETDTFTFDAAKGLPIDYPAFTPAQELLVTILTAVHQHDQNLFVREGANRKPWELPCTWQTDLLTQKSCP